ncbi:MAG: hypothetical protein RL757_2279 [Bacteroidota bacterium]
MTTNTNHIQVYELLSRFCDALEADGYPMGVDVQQQLRDFSTHFDIETLSQAQLKNYLTAILARNQQDQAQIYRLFDRAVESVSPHPSIQPPKSDISAPIVAATTSFWAKLKSNATLQNLWKQRWYWLPFLLLGGAFGIYQWLTPPPKQLPIEKKQKTYNIIHVGLNDTTATLRYANLMPNLKSIEKIDNQTHQFIQDEIRGLDYRYRGIYDTRTNEMDTIGLKICLNDGFCDTIYNVFLVKKRLERRQAENVLPIAQQYEKPLSALSPRETWGWNWKVKFLSWEKILAMLALYSIGMGVSIRYRRHLREIVEEEKKVFDEQKAKREAEQKAQNLPIETDENKTYVLERNEGERPPYVWNLQLDTLPKIALPPSLQTVVQQLRTRSEGDIRMFEIKKTVQKSIHHPDNIDFVYFQKTEPNEYLILVDMPHPQSHRARLTDWLVKNWQQNEVYIERFFFNGDIRLAWNEKNPRGLNLQELQMRFPSHRLLIFGNAFQLLAPATGQLAKWTNIFDVWQRKAILSARPPNEWDRRETALTEKFLLAQQSSEGLKFVVEHLDLIGEMTAAQRLGRVSVPISLASIQLDHLFDENAVDTGGGDILTILKSHFAKYEENVMDDRLLQWLAACAIYPTLEWDWTLSVGGIIQKMTKTEGFVSIENLLLLSRLNWFDAGVMPDRARQILMDWLNQTHPEVLVRVRESLQNVMQHNPPPNQSVAFESFQMTLVLNEMLLKPDNERKNALQNQLDEFSTRNLPHDYVTLTVLDREKTELDVIVPPLWLDLLNAQKKQTKVDFQVLDAALARENLEQKIEKYLEIARQIGDVETVKQLETLLKQVNEIENMPPTDPEMTALIRKIEGLIIEKKFDAARQQMRYVADALNDETITKTLENLEKSSM